MDMFRTIDWEEWDSRLKKLTNIKYVEQIS